MTTATKHDVGVWVDEALDRKDFDSGDLVYELLHHGPIDRWACSDEKCPARPDWDKALSELFEDLSSKLDDEIQRVVTRTLVTGLTTFLAEHPETPLRTETAAA